MSRFFDWLLITLALVGAIAIVLMVWATISEWREQRGDEDEWDLWRVDEDASPTEVARSAAAALEIEHEWWNMDLGTLETLPEFSGAVERLADDETSVDDVVSLSRDGNGWVASIALAALAQRDDVPDEWVLWAARHPERPSNIEDALLLQVLGERAKEPVIGVVLPALGAIQSEAALEFVRARLAHGETVDETTFARLSLGDEDQTAALVSFMDRYERELGPDFRSSYDSWRATQHLRGAGRVREKPYDRPPALLVGRRRGLVELVLTALEQSPPRSVLLVGEHGVGKTALARAALDRLEGDVVVFDTTAAQLNAGATFVGELEGRVKALVDAVAGQRVVWLLPELQEALFAGQHLRSPQGLLDALLPHIEAGAITIVAEVTPSAAELLVASRPRVATAFELVRVRPLGEADTVAVAKHALEQDALGVTTDDATLAESFELAQQFLPGVAAPGNLLRIMSATAAEAAEQGAESFDKKDVLATLTSSSGLPLALLDPTSPLPLEDVRAFFSERVLEQPDAVECIVERIAMVKAGLTDPTRPLGVFLFVGPTGTGKTEIAKALAEFLFGSPDRLVRLDMTEYRTPESLERLLADTATEPHGATLVSSVRKEPFAVILLDEFEKAAQPIWDLFLQVFDDGRLTDLQGRVVDFRRCVIVLTSNLGAPLAHGAAVGFEPPKRTFTAAGIERAVESSFRPEFRNRLDRIVVFRPFERSAMRALLDKELADALARRGLRGRPWAVEVDESAYAFLIDKGFSPDLGARPLKRALERHLLAPIAAAIVEQEVPDGDQFLFVTASGGERIDVTFVDPDAEPETVDADEPAPADLRALVRSPRGDDASVQFVLAELARVREVVDGLQVRKGHALSVISEPGFWERDDRFELLAEAEYLDRLAAATRTADSLGARLSRSAKANGGAATELVELLAGRTYVLDCAVAGIAAGRPAEVFVRVRPAGTEADAGSFARQVAEMYAGWARRRGMQLQRLDAPPGEHLFAVSGLGCGEILESESGLHVLEQVDDERDGDRVVERDRVRVQVVPRVPGPQLGRVPLARHATSELDRVEAPAVVVRRYRPGRSPLVRDSVRAYRSGRLDRVLAGDFDLY
jgi:ATP-dependent Clp protease ATP-binding subunit ClpC